MTQMFAGWRGGGIFFPFCTEAFEVARCDKWRYLSPVGQKVEASQELYVPLETSIEDGSKLTI